MGVSSTDFGRGQNLTTARVLSAALVQSKNAQVPPAEERGIFLQAMTAQGWRLKPKESAPPLASQPATPTRPPARTNIGGAM